MKAPSRPVKEPIEKGTHLAICYGVVDLGTQEVHYPGSPPGTARQICLFWEFPNITDEYDDNGIKVIKPRVIHQDYTFSTFDKAKLSLHVTPWMGECPDNFDFETLLGQPCQIAVVHKKKCNSDGSVKAVYANIGGVMGVAQGTPIPEMFNPRMYYYLNDHGQNRPACISKWYDWLWEKIEKCTEFASMTRAATVMGATAQQQVNYEEAGEPIPANIPDDHPAQGAPIDDDDIPF